MKTTGDRQRLRAQLAECKQRGQRIAFVPTMGNLHDGHLSLVREARRHCDRVVVSIFVNPTQFGPGEDFDAYPRTLDADAARLREAGVEVLFAPTVEAMYPLGANRTWVDVDALGDYLCGADRPGHFRGVATVVSKLFNIVQPDVAVFGEKDFQQLAILRRMAAELLFPIRLIGAPTAREADGLAMSSRNGFLTETERARAPLLQQHLQDARRAVEQGERDYRALEKRIAVSLAEHGFDVDYVTVANATTLAPAAAEDRELVIAAAARLGRPRLIDNLTLSLPAA